MDARMSFLSICCPSAEMLLLSDSLVRTGMELCSEKSERSFDRSFLNPRRRA